MNCVSLGSDMGKRELGKCGIVDMTVEGQHPLGMLQRRRILRLPLKGLHGWAGATRLTNAAPIPPTLVFLLFPPGLRRQWALVIAGTSLPCLAAVGQGSTTDLGMLF